MGLRYWATGQTVEETRRRIAGGRCLVALLDGKIVGTLTCKRHNDWEGSEWIRRPDVAVVGQFAVEPSLQRNGIGSALMDAAERIAIAEGAAEVALSTAEPAAHLVDYYRKRGYRIVDHTDATLNQGYRSVIMSKQLSTGP